MLRVNQLTGFANRAVVTAPGAFPLVNGTNTSTEEADVTSHAVLLPASVAIGELLIVTITLGNATTNVTTISTPSGWTALFNEAQAGRTSAGFYRVADGSEGASVAVSSSEARSSVHQSFRISNYQGSPEAAATNAISADPDPPSLSPSWGSADNLWLVFEGHRSGNVAASALPPGYSNDLTIRNGGAATTNGFARSTTARRNLTTASENPGAFTLGSGTTRWVAATIAIRGA
ncbi:hypothetical protein [Mesorhizobium sp.]|uniref:hypothetical protein n=1 Tax=Mesorhizobium sp. TaxID=1871066 RepID=UPI00120BDBB6|nr:hypothetical protein [Mesorhizobium sp.]TIL64497.1 MAG: hypothetical protein E5Y77_26285 [Mesorhizobium sp.]